MEDRRHQVPDSRAEDKKHQTAYRAEDNMKDRRHQKPDSREEDRKHQTAYRAENNMKDRRHQKPDSRYKTQDSRHNKSIFPFGDHFINTCNLFSWLYSDIISWPLMLLTHGTFKSQVDKNLMVNLDNAFDTATLLFTQWPHSEIPNYMNHWMYS